MHVAEMPDQVGDRPARAVLDPCRQVACRSGGEAGGMLLDRRDVVELGDRHSPTVLAPRLSAERVLQPVKETHLATDQLCARGLEVVPLGTIYLGKVLHRA